MIITTKYFSSVQISACDIKADDAINLTKSYLINMCGYVRGTGQIDLGL